MFVPQENRHDGPILKRDVISEVIYDTADLLLRDGWVNANPILYGGGRHCLAQALSLSAIDKIDYWQVEAAVFSAIRELHGGQWRDIADWNDAPGRTFDDVMAALQLATQV